MRTMPGLFCVNNIRFERPLLYFLVENHVVLPIRAIGDFQESVMQKNAFPLERSKQKNPIHVFSSGDVTDMDRTLTMELRKKEKVYPDHPALVPDLSNLATIYMMQKKLAEAQATMQRAVDLQAQITSGTDALPGKTNLAIIRYLNNDKSYCKQAFESCVTSWYQSGRTLNVRALPYFYNLLVMSDDSNTAFRKKALEDFNSICQTLNPDHPFFQNCCAQQITLRPQITYRHSR